MSAIAIITARGGSKRIPRKNIKCFCGKPIIAYSIEAAVKSKIFDEIMVSTDDKEIAEIALSYGAKVPFYRSTDTSDDYATTADVLIEVLEMYKDKRECFDRVCCIYPTAPFVTARKLQEAMSRLDLVKADALVPVVRFSYPPQRSFIMHNKKISYKWPENISLRSQDLEPFYHDAGQFYLINTETFLSEKSLVPTNTSAYELSEQEVQDIDTFDDWEIAEMKYMLMQKRTTK